jgi:transcriptional regulator with PAS, ATPase and Fis domain
LPDGVQETGYRRRGSFREQFPVFRRAAVKDITAYHVPPFTGHDAGDVFRGTKEQDKQASPRTLTPAALDFLMKYDWPGNVRELQNVIEFLVVMSQGEVIDVGDLPPKIVGSVRGIVQKPKDSGRLSLREAVEEYERELITRALREHGTLREAAESLGIDLSTLTRKKQKYGLIKN